MSSPYQVFKKGLDLVDIRLISGRLSDNSTLSGPFDIQCAGSFRIFRGGYRYEPHSLKDCQGCLAGTRSGRAPSVFAAFPSKSFQNSSGYELFSFESSSSTKTLESQPPIAAFTRHPLECSLRTARVCRVRHGHQTAYLEQMATTSSCDQSSSISHGA